MSTVLPMQFEGLEQEIQSLVSQLDTVHGFLQVDAQMGHYPPQENADEYLQFHTPQLIQRLRELLNDPVQGVVAEERLSAQGYAVTVVEEQSRRLYLKGTTYITL